MTWWAWLAKAWISRARGRILARSLRIISIVSIALSVAALIIVHAVFSGFHQALAEKFLNVSPHIVLTPNDASTYDAQPLQFTTHADPSFTLYPIVRGDVVAQVAGREGYADVGITLYGVDVAMLARWKTIEWLFAHDVCDQNRDAAQTPSACSLADALTAALSGDGRHTLVDDGLFRDPNLAGAICGFDVMSTLGADPTTEELRFIAPLSLIDPAGNLQPFSRRAAPRALFRTKLYAFDSTTCFLPRTEAETLLGVQAHHEWWGFATDTTRVDEIAHQLQMQMGSTFAVTTWRERNARLFAALRTEERIVILLLVLIGLIAMTTLASTVTLLARQHQRDVAMTMVLGATPALMQRLVFMLGARLAASGLAWGVLFSLATLAILHWWPIALPATFYLDQLPVLISWRTILLPACAVWIATCAAAYYPAWRLRTLSVAQILREG